MHSAAVIALPVQGMTCAGCATRLERVLSRLEGVETAAVNLLTEAASVRFDEELVEAGRIVQAIEKAGFSVPPSTLRLTLGGMSCATYAGRIEKLLRSQPGVLSAQVNLASEVATVAFIPGLCSSSELQRAVERAGYTARLAPSSGEERATKAAAEAAQERRELVVLLGAAALSAPLVAPMLAMPLGLDLSLPGWLQLALALPVQLVAGARFYRGALSSLRARVANMDVLVALGTTAAFAMSLFAMFRGGALYFESAAVIITLIRAGKWMERRAKRSTTRAIEALTALRPAVARVERDGQTLEIPAEAVGRGEIVLVRPGERVPADGRILSGESSLDESLLSGESMPVRRGPGDDITGGSINGEGWLRVETTRVGDDSTLAHIIALVEGAQAGKAPIQQVVDRISAIFVPAVVAISLMTVITWLLLGYTAEQAWLAAVAVLVIACPCALGLATPTALMVGTGVAARAGILIKDAAAMERAHAVTSVVFDKTGTLTEGRPRLRRIAALSGDADELLAVTASAQQGSEHPLATALMDAAEQRGLALLPLEDFQMHPGRGIQARVSDDEVRVGSPAWMRELGHDLGDIESDVAGQQETGTVMLAAVNGVLRGWLAVADPVRLRAKAAVDALGMAGIESVMLTGDNRRTADAVAAQLRIARVFAEVLPGGKAERVAELRGDGRVVAMVGDGVNDAPALAAADVGFAMSTGTDVAMHTAGITLMRAEPMLIVDAISISHATSRKIRQNLFWAFAYNLVGLPLAALGLLSPIIAGGAMALSSVSVVSNALLLRRWKGAA